MSEIKRLSSNKLQSPEINLVRQCWVTRKFDNSLNKNFQPMNQILRQNLQQQLYQKSELPVQKISLEIYFHAYNKLHFLCISILYICRFTAKIGVIYFTWNIQRFLIVLNNNDKISLGGTFSHMSWDVHKKRLTWLIFTCKQVIIFEIYVVQI